MNKKISKVTKSSFALMLCSIMVFTSSSIVNAAEKQNSTEYQSFIPSALNEILPEKDAEEVKVVDKITELDTKDIIVDEDNIYSSRRLIITSKDEMEFRDSKLSNNIVSVQRLNNQYYIVEYASIEDTKDAYEFYTNLGYEVEIDVVNDTPKVENTDNKDNIVKDKEIASTNDKDKQTLDLKDKDEKVQKEINDSVIVAVLDTGLNNGEEIFDNRIIEGVNFVDDEDDYNDTSGHGTAMARIVLDSVEDVNKDNHIKIMPIKILNDNGKGTTLSAYKGIHYAIEQRVDVINLSMSGVGQSKLLQSAINDAYKAGIPVVVSAGNDNKNVKDYTPANINSAFTITATDFDKDNNIIKAGYSNYGKVDFSAYGHYEYARDIDKKEVITKIDGTSVSSAYVTSYIAMLKQMANNDEDIDIFTIGNIYASLYESAIELDDKQSFGNGYLSKENIVLSLNDITELIPADEDVAGVYEDIELTKNDRAHVRWREVYVMGFNPDTNWSIEIYEVQDGATQWGPAYTPIDAKRVWKNGYTEMTVMGGGLVKVWTYNDYALVRWEDVHLDVSTTWIRGYLDLPQGYEYDYTEFVDHPWNADQDILRQDQEVHYQGDTLNQYVDVYAGIGFYGKDIGFHYKRTHQDFNVTYFTDGGSWDNIQGDTFTLDYDYNGYNPIFGFVGTDANASPKKDGYIFKGWYFTDWNWSIDTSTWCNVPKNSITDLIDYAHRYPDVPNAPGYNFLGIPLLYKINEHVWGDGAKEGRRYADRPASVLDSLNGYNFDDYRQLLKPGERVGGFSGGMLNCEGKSFVAFAVYEKVPGFEVTWDTNGGKWTDGSKNAITFSYSASGQNEAIPSYYVGIDANASPTKDGKVLKGWYFTYDDGTQRKFPQVTNMIDYYNRNSDLQPEGICTGFGMINMNALWRHWNDCGQYESEPGRHKYAERARTLNDIDNKDSDYDYGNQLLKPGQCFCNTYVEGSYDLKNVKLRAYAIYEDADYTITYDMQGGVNNPRNPTAYKKNTEVIHIYKPNDWSDDNYQYTFAGWKCDKAVKIGGSLRSAGTTIGNSGNVLDIDAGDYGNLKFTAQWIKTKISSSLGWSYNIIWDSNGNWNDGRNDKEKINYDHSYYNKYHYYTLETRKNGTTYKKWHNDYTYYKGELATYEEPSTPRTATLYFDDPNGHGNTSNISASIQTQKRFDGWKQIKTTGTRTKTQTIWQNSEGEYEKEYHDSNYRADSPWKSPGKFRDLVDAGKTTTLQAQWTRLPEELPSVSKPGYDFLGWQINGVAA